MNEYIIRRSNVFVNGYAIEISEDSRVIFIGKDEEDGKRLAEEYIKYITILNTFKLIVKES